MQDAPAKPAATQPVQPAQTRGQRPQVPGVYFDSDMGQNIDTVIALAVLYGSYAKVKLIGNSVSNGSLEAAAFCDVMGRFYAAPASNAPFSPSYYNPVGLAENGARPAHLAMLGKPLAMKGSEGQPVFPHNIRDISDTADVRTTLRNSLLTQKEGEGIVVMAGPAGNLVRALSMPGNKEVIAARTGVLVVAAGAYPSGAVDPRIQSDITAARTLFAEWPSPIVAVGMEAGAAVPYPAASIATDFSWAPHHPVVEAYRAYQPMPYDAPSQAAAAALFAAFFAGNHTGDLFELSEPGTIRVLDDGRTRFEPSASGKHRYLIVPGAKKEQIAQAYISAASAKPAPPPVRNRPPQQQADATPKRAEKIANKP